MQLKSLLKIKGLMWNWTQCDVFFAFSECMCIVYKARTFTHSLLVNTIHVFALLTGADKKKVKQFERSVCNGRQTLYKNSNLLYLA